MYVYVLTALLVLLAPLLAAANDGQLYLLHRLYGPGVPEQPFTLRATLDPSALHLTPVPNLQSALGQFYADVGDNKGALYQLALQTAPGAGPQADERLDISAVKACHIPTASSDYLTLHLDRAGTPFHIDYYLGNVSPSSACPTSKQLRALNLDLDQATWLHPSNTTIRVRYARPPPLPELRTPPPLSPRGQVIHPEPEKSFIQKYWMYIVPALLMLLLSGGAAPEEGGGQSAGGRST